MTTEAVSKPSKRDDKGRFLPGTAPGPGRPPSTTPITDLLRCEVAKRPQLVKALCDMAEDDWRAMLAILDRLEPTAKANAGVNIEQAVINIVRSTPELGVGG